MQVTPLEFRNRWWIFAALCAGGHGLRHGSAQLSFGLRRPAARFRHHRSCEFVAADVRRGQAFGYGGSAHSRLGSGFAERRCDARRAGSHRKARCPWCSPDMRNPLYFGNVLTAIAAGFMAGRVGSGRIGSPLLGGSAEARALPCAERPGRRGMLRVGVRCFDRADVWRDQAGYGSFCRDAESEILLGIFAVALAASFFYKRPRQKTAA